MVAYRRARVAGATYFFTVTLADRRSCALVDRLDILRGAFAGVLGRHPVRTEAIVVLPNHLHALWTLPAGDVDYSTRWRLIKSEFTRGLRAEDCVGPRVTPSLWQARFWEHLVRDDEDFARHVDYIHFNPVKHGWVRRVRDWPWSSFHRFSRTGNLPLDWSGP